MNPITTIVFFALLFAKSLCLEADPRAISNVTVMGTVFCDACANNFFSKHSYFLEGVKVRVQCMFKVNSTSREEISITVDRTTDKFGIYKLDIPPVDGFECREGLELDSCCRASLLGSPSFLCNVPGLSSSTVHMAIRAGEGRQCLYNLNALNYRPSNKDINLCGTSSEHLSSAMNNSLFFWPPFPPFGFPWPHMPPLPYPFQSPSSQPFPFPSIPFLTPPPSFPWPFPPLFPTPSPPSFPFPFTPAPNPPALLPPIPSLFPSPPPIPFQFPPFPSFTPIPPLFRPPSPPPPPPPPSFPFPFPPFPFPPFSPTIPTPGVPSSPPPTFSLRDPRTWFPHHPPSPSRQP